MSTATGKKGEELAANFLKEKGYEIVMLNYRYQRNEIDIIAKDQACLVFVEVKAKRSYSFGYPEEAVDKKKAARIIEAAENYIFDQNWNGLIRFDIVSILLQKAENKINHFKDAFH